MRRRLHLTKPARSDVRGIWEYSAAQYGWDRGNAYFDLIARAIQDIRNNPERVGSLNREDIGPGVRAYHISLSKERRGSRIKNPRHFVFYTLRHRGVVVVLRILHDAMDPSLHIDDTPEVSPE